MLFAPEHFVSCGRAMYRRRVVKAVANAVDSPDQLGIGTVGLDLTPQPVDMNIQRAGPDALVVSLDVQQQPL
jgi:hypothetical protein